VQAGCSPVVRLFAGRVLGRHVRTLLLARPRRAGARGRDVYLWRTPHRSDRHSHEQPDPRLGRLSAADNRVHELDKQFSIGRRGRTQRLSLAGSTRRPECPEQTVSNEGPCSDPALASLFEHPFCNTRCHHPSLWPIHDGVTLRLRGSSPQAVCRRFHFEFPLSAAPPNHGLNYLTSYLSPAERILLPSCAVYRSYSPDPTPRWTQRPSIAARPPFSSC